MANADGTLNSQIKYTAFGEIRSQSGASPTDYLYTGQRQEAELGLYYYVARWYDPAIGRFIQADTIVPNPSSAKAFDRYAYALNNPVKYIDPTGHVPYGEDEDDICLPSQNCWSDYGDPAPRVLVGGSGINGVGADGPKPNVQMPAWKDIADKELIYHGAKYNDYPAGKVSAASFLWDELGNWPSLNLICYSASADACLIFANEYVKSGGRLNGLILIGPTGTTGENQLPSDGMFSVPNGEGGTYGALMEATHTILDTVIGSGTKVLWVNDRGWDPVDSFHTYSPPAGYESLWEPLVIDADHYGGTAERGVGMNNNIDRRNEVLDAMGWGE